MKTALTIAALIASAVLICSVSFACAADRSHGLRDFALALQPIESRIPAGTSPRFRITLTNISDHTCRVLNIERRVDLQHTYFDLVVTKDGEPVRLPRAISDPGPISDADWLQIAPGGTKSFTLASFPQTYDRLPPGTHEAYVQFWHDPFQSRTTAYKSETAKFTVTK
jgi:hypothetical protein